MEKVKKILAAVGTFLEELGSLLRGENKALARKLVIGAAVAFVAVCTFLTLMAIRKAKKEKAAAE